MKYWIITLFVGKVPAWANMGRRRDGIDPNLKPEVCSETHSACVIKDSFSRFEGRARNRFTFC